MALRYYTDVHIPAPITEGLRRRGVDVLTSQEDGTREAEDEDLLDRATELQRVFLSQDHDLLRIAAQWQASERPFAGLVFAEQATTSFGQCIEDLELMALCCEAEEVASQVTYLPLR